MVDRVRRPATIVGALAVLLAASVDAASLGVLAVAAEPAASGGTFVAAGSLLEPRLEHTATLLQDGTVLVIGGTNDEGGLASAERYDPASGSSTPAGTLGEVRAAHTATLLSDGRVLVVGGYNEDVGTLATAELWDPDSEAFEATASLAEARNSHTATLLEDGRVLVVGGLTNDGLNLRVNAELWDPDTAVFSPAGVLAEGRAAHTATLTPDGVLVVGGLTTEGELRSSAELWVPGNDAFVLAGTLIEARAGHTATRLSDGVLVVAGSGVSDVPTSAALASAEWWDPEAGTFSPAGSLAETRTLHSATFLPDGRVLVAGGVDLIDLRGTAELWDPESRSFTPTGPLTAPRGWHTATLEADGGVLLIGGDRADEGPTTAVERWTVGAGPSPSPSPSPTIPADLDAALGLVELLGKVPTELLASCQPAPKVIERQRASVVCVLGEDSVSHAIFADQPAMEAAYADAAGTVSGGTSCADGAFEGVWVREDGADAGRVVCQARDDGLALVWSDAGNLVVGVLLLKSGGGFPELHDLWLRVRPGTVPDEVATR